MTRKEPEAPLELVELTKAVRELIGGYDGDVRGSCVEACMVLGRALRARGHPAEMKSYSASGDPHWCIKSMHWVLDPTSGQWGEEPILVFRAGSQDDGYEPGYQGTSEISDEEVVRRFAIWGDPETEKQLLTLAGLAALIPEVERARERIRLKARRRGRA